MSRLVALAIVLATGTPALAQTPVASTEAFDPARLAAARDLIDVVMPPARRGTMIDAMMTSMTANLQQSIGTQGELQDPRVKAIFDRYIAKQTDDSKRAFQAALPGMVTAMTRAYARRFTVPQMAEMRAFFATPVGQLYMDQGSTIMSDPDVTAWQRATMAPQWQRIRDSVRTMQLEILSLPEKPQ